MFTAIAVVSKQASDWPSLRHLVVMQTVVRIEQHIVRLSSHAAHSAKEIALENKAQTCFDRDPEKMAALGYPGAEKYLKEDDVPTLFPVVEAMLMPSIRINRTQSSTRLATTILA